MHVYFGGDYRRNCNVFPRLFRSANALRAFSAIKAERLTLGDSPVRPLTPLTRAEMRMRTLHNLRSLLNDLLAFSQDELDVAGVRHVRINL